MSQVNRPARASATARCRTRLAARPPELGLDAVLLLEGRRQRDRILRVQRRVDDRHAFLAGAGQDARLPVRGIEQVAARDAASGLLCARAIAGEARSASRKTRRSMVSFTLLMFSLLGSCSRSAFGRYAATEISVDDLTVQNDGGIVFRRVLDLLEVIQAARLENPVDHRDQPDGLSALAL